MNIEELRQALASDATEKAKQQEKHIKELEKKLKNSEIKINEQNDMLRAMFNRCRAQNTFSGAIMMCMFCGLRTACENYHSLNR